MIAHDDEYKNHIQRLNVYVERVIGKDAALVFYQKRRADCKRNAGNIGYRLKEQAFFVSYLLCLAKNSVRAIKHGAIIAPDITSITITPAQTYPKRIVIRQNAGKSKKQTTIGVQMNSV